MGRQRALPILLTNFDLLAAFVLQFLVGLIISGVNLVLAVAGVGDA